MTSIDCDGEFRGKEGKDDATNPGGPSGVCQISRSGEELLADGNFFSGEAFPLSGKPITFSHIVSKTRDVSLQSGVTEVPESSVDESSAGVVGLKDLEGVVSKEPWLCKVRGRVGIGMEVAGINLRYWPLATFDLWVE
jgi:hypothetical protein